MTDAVAEPKRSTWESIAAFFDRRTLIMLMLGFSAGLPNLLIYDTLSVWLRQAKVDVDVITLMSLVGLVVGWLVFRGLQRVLPKRVGLVPVLAAVGAFVSVPAAALAFTGLYAVGGTAPIPLDTLAAAMLGWHTLIGVGEAVITGLVVGSVVAVRPDLVYGARPALAVRPLEIRSDAGASA